MILCYVTDRLLLQKRGHSNGGLDELLRCIECAVACGVDWIQIREKDLSARELLELTRRAVSLAGRRSRMIVNDRLDIALTAEAAGVHLGSASAPAAEVIRWLRAGNAPKGFLVGVSCHSLEEARAAENAGANYVFFGPVYNTPSKETFGPPQGIKKLQQVCCSVRIPVLAIGGIDEKTFAGCLRASASGIAAIRLFQEMRGSSQLAAAVSRIRSFNAKKSARNG